MTRPDIPLPIQRAVRQRCGFGCVICGLPLYEYDHILGWASTERHEAEEIVLLCDKHHREKTSGLLPVDTVRAANESPFNLRTGTSKPYDLHFDGTECEAVIGGNRFTTQDAGYGTLMIPVSVDGVPLLGVVLADGHLLLHMNLFDEFNNLVLIIRNNELVYRPDTWDIQFVGRNLTVREAQRKLLIDIEFDVPNRINIKRGRFLCNGVEILVRPDHLLITNNATLISDCSAINCAGGLVIGPHAQQFGSMMRIDGVPRYQWDRTETLKWARESMGEGNA